MHDCTSTALCEGDRGVIFVPTRTTLVSFRLRVMQRPARGQRPICSPMAPAYLPMIRDDEAAHLLHSHEGRSLALRATRRGRRREVLSESRVRESRLPVHATIAPNVQKVEPDQT